MFVQAPFRFKQTVGYINLRLSLPHPRSIRPVDQSKPDSSLDHISLHDNCSKLRWVDQGEDGECVSEGGQNWTHCQGGK